MARHLLEHNEHISYEALEFSEVCFNVVRKTLGELAFRVVFTKADLMNQEWPRKLTKTPDAIVSTWALQAS